MTIAEESFRFSGLYEAELLIELMLRYWQHPLADDREYRSILLENAVEVLRTSIAGSPIIAGMAPKNMNLVAAVWYSEWSALQQQNDENADHFERRREWVVTIRRSIPSCFCDSDLLE